MWDLHLLAFCLFMKGIAMVDLKDHQFCEFWTKLLAYYIGLLALSAKLLAYYIELPALITFQNTGNSIQYANNFA